MRALSSRPFCPYKGRPGKLVVISRRVQGHDLAPCGSPRPRATSLAVHLHVYNRTIGAPVAGGIVVIALRIVSSCLWMEHGRRAWHRRDAPQLSPPAPWRFRGMAGAWEIFDRWHAMLGGLGKELHEVEHLRRHLVGDRQSQLLGFRDADRIIVRPGAFREHSCEVGG